MPNAPENINNEDLGPHTQPADQTAEKQVVKAPTTGLDASPIDISTSGQMFERDADFDMSWTYRGMPKDGAQLPPPTNPQPADELTDHDWQVLERDVGLQFEPEVRSALSNKRQEFWKSFVLSSKSNDDYVTKRRPVDETLMSISSAARTFAEAFRRASDRNLLEAVAYALSTSTEKRLGEPEVVSARLTFHAHDLEKIARFSAEAASELPIGRRGRVPSGIEPFIIACAEAYQNAGGTVGSNTKFIAFVRCLHPDTGARTDSPENNEKLRKAIEAALGPKNANRQTQQIGTEQSDGNN